MKKRITEKLIKPAEETIKKDSPEDYYFEVDMSKGYFEGNSYYWTEGERIHVYPYRGYGLKEFIHGGTNWTSVEELTPDEYEYWLDYWEQQGRPDKLDFSEWEEREPVE